MASQMAFRLTSKIQPSSRLFENIAATPRCIHNICTLSGRLLAPAHHFSSNKRNTQTLSTTDPHPDQHTHTSASEISLEDNYFQAGYSSRLCHGCKASEAVETLESLKGRSTALKKFRVGMMVFDQCRSFSTSACEASKFGVGGHEEETQLPRPKSDDSDWALRLANENGYLSWCRNTYLATVVALALIEEGKMAFAEQAAEGALVVAALNLTWGTYQYVYNMVRLRRLTGTTWLGVGAYGSLAALHLVLWFTVCATFMGLTADTDDIDVAGGTGVGEEVEGGGEGQEQ